jgi:hypothetical protein
MNKVRRRSGFAACGQEGRRATVGCRRGGTGGAMLRAPVGLGRREGMPAATRVGRKTGIVRLCLAAGGKGDTLKRGLQTRIARLAAWLAKDGAFAGSKFKAGQKLGKFLRLISPFYGIFAFLRLFAGGGGQRRGWRMAGGRAPRSNSNSKSERLVHFWSLAFASVRFRSLGWGLWAKF